MDDSSDWEKGFYAARNNTHVQIFCKDTIQLKYETVKTLRKKAAEFSWKIRRIDNLRKNLEDGIKARRYFWE